MPFILPFFLRRPCFRAVAACRQKDEIWIAHPATELCLITLPLPCLITRSVTRGTTDKVVTSIEDLGSKRCLACEGGEVDPLTDDQISHLASLVRRL